MSEALAPPHAVRILHGDLWRGGRLVLRSDELEIPLPSIVGLIGANGAGKSTLLHSLANVLGPSATVRVTIDEQVVHSAALVTQSPELPHWLTLDEILDLANCGETATSMIDDLEIGSLRNRRAATFSAGQRQLVGLVLGLSSGEALTLLDEPLAHLDMRARSRVSHWIKEVSRAGRETITFISSHSPAELIDLCDWIVAIRRAEYSFSGPKSALLPLNGQDGVRSRLRRRMLELV
ncbi:MAG TPA: ATP-binding cassette domain-containing protein [Gemmatimonadaceae bacterium]|nr:ATP-binding cassette domain-containing protein [Gemmatimonadaceae bacterium]